MNDRLTRNVPGVMKAINDAPDVKYDPSNPTLAAELHKTQGLLQRALEVAETIGSRLRPVPASDAVKKSRATIGGVVGDAQVNCELANDVCNRLDEIAGLVG